MMTKKPKPMTVGELREKFAGFDPNMFVEFSCSGCIFKNWVPQITVDSYPNFLTEPTYYLSIHLEGISEALEVRHLACG
jgi:hypothetical protein